MSRIPSRTRRNSGPGVTHGSISVQEGQPQVFPLQEQLARLNKIGLSYTIELPGVSQFESWSSWRLSPQQLRERSPREATANSTDQEFSAKSGQCPGTANCRNPASRKHRRVWCERGQAQDRPDFARSRRSAVATSEPDTALLPFSRRAGEHISPAGIRQVRIYFPCLTSGPP